MTLEEIREYLRRKNWTLQIQVRRGRGKKFLYAKRKVRGMKMITRYIGAESKIAEMTEDEIRSKLYVEEIVNRETEGI